MYNRSNERTRDVYVSFLPLTAMHFVVIEDLYALSLTEVAAPAGNVTYGNCYNKIHVK